MEYEAWKATWKAPLNPQQEAAVQAAQGPVLLLAVPGSGKTTVLIHRLGYLIFCLGVAPEQILTVTYTVAATRDMAARFARTFGETWANRLEFRTINGLSARIIQHYERVKGRQAFTLVTEEGRLASLVGELYRKATGEFATDYSDASGTNLLDIEKKVWSDEMLRALDIPARLLPPLHRSSDVIGGVTEEAARATGLLAGTPVVLGGGDGSCACVGAGVVRPGRAYNVLGSSSWISLAAEKPLFDEEMRTFTWAHIVPGLYSPTGTMQAGGSSYNWLKGQVAKYETAVAKVQGISPYDLINAEAAKSPVGANGVLFLPYLLGERAPRWNPDATAAWLGLKMENQRCDLFRAVLEGVTLNLNIILESFRRSIPIDELLVVGGGAKGALWCQMMADVYNARIKVPVLLEEATSMGAAVTGGVGVGVFKGFEVIDQMLELNRTVEPDPEAVAAYGPVKEAFEVCYKAMLPVYEYMASHKNA